MARNCKDVIVSSYHFLKKLGLWTGDNIEDYIEDFIHDELNYTNYWNHIVDYWRMRNEPHIFFVTYEEMKRDLAGVIRGLCDFLERPQLTAEEMAKTVEHLSFDKMKSGWKDLTNQKIKKYLNISICDSQIMKKWPKVWRANCQKAPRISSKIFNIFFLPPQNIFFNNL